MNEPGQLYTGLSQAAWGYFLITFDFNINGVSVLPRFAGYILLYLAIDKLSKARRDLNLLRPLCVLLVCWSFVNWLMSWGGGSLDEDFLFLGLVAAVAMLYFHFQFLTDMAALAGEYQPDDDNLAARIRSHRTANTLLVTSVSLLGSASQVLPWEGWGGIIVFVSVIGFIVALLIMADLFHLRRLAPKLDTEAQ